MCHFTSKRWSRVLWGVGLLCVANALSAADELRELKDVPYKSGAVTDYERQRCKLDLYLPQNVKRFATVVWFHGGGLQNGDKAGDTVSALARRLGKSGIAIASANYRLHPQVEFPAFVDDAAAAVAYVHGKIGEYGGSRERVFVSGHSAGGYLTAMVGVDGRYLAKYDRKLRDVAGLMPVSGQMITHSTIRLKRGIAGTQPIIDDAAPAFHVKVDASPFLCIVGGEDLPTRAEENRYFVAAMKAAGHKEVTYLEVPGRNHSTIANQVADSNDAVANAMIAFVERLSR